MGSSPWQAELPLSVLAYLPVDEAPTLRLACQSWENAINDTVKSLAPPSLTCSDSLHKFSNLKHLDLRSVPYPEDEELQQEDVGMMTPQNSRSSTQTPRSTASERPVRGHCDWCSSLQGPQGFCSWKGMKELQALSMPLGCCDNCLAAAAARFHHIDNLQLSGGFISDEGVKVAATSWPLAEFQLLDGGCVTDKGMECLAELGARLTKLMINGANRITDAGVLSLASHYASNLGPGKGLQVLSLSDCMRLKGEGLSCFQALKSLDLSNCQFVTDLALQDLQDLHQLRVLRLAGCFGITDSGLEFIRGLNLSMLDLKGCERLSDATVAQTVARMHNLRALVLEGVHRLSDEGLAKLGECHALEKLSIKGCSQVSDVGIAVFAANCPHLHWLDISGCKRITHKGLFSIAKHLRGLKHLAMAHCTGASNSGLAALGAAQLPLTFLNLSSCSRITGTGLAALQLLAPTLRTLHVSWTDLNDPAALQLQSLTQLRHLHMEGCCRVSVKVITSLTSRLPLKTLATQACSKPVAKLGFSGVAEEDGIYIPVQLPLRSPAKTVAVQTDLEAEENSDAEPQLQKECKLSMASMMEALDAGKEEKVHAEELRVEVVGDEVVGMYVAESPGPESVSKSGVKKTWLGKAVGKWTLRRRKQPTSEE